jgi:hypothetical protein
VLAQKQNWPVTIAFLKTTQRLQRRNAKSWCSNILLACVAMALRSNMPFLLSSISAEAAVPRVQCSPLTTHHSSFTTCLYSYPLPTGRIKPTPKPRRTAPSRKRKAASQVIHLPVVDYFRNRDLEFIPPSVLLITKGL